MLQQQKVGRPQWTVFVIQAAVALLAALLFFSWKYPSLPKAIFYSLYRDFTRRVTEFETRNWSTVEGKRFLVRFQEADREWAPLVLANGEQVYEAVYRYVPVDLPDKALLLVAPDQEAMNRSMGWSGDQSAMGVYFAGVIRVLSPAEFVYSEDPVQMVQELDEKGPVAHELTHLLVDYRTKGNYSRWFTEGIAQYVESRVVGFRLDEPAPGWEGRLYPFESMDRGFDDLPDEMLAYRQSLAMVEYLAAKYGEGVLIEIMDELAKGSSEKQALAAVTGIPWDQLLQEFQQSLVPKAVKQAS